MTDDELKQLVASNSLSIDALKRTVEQTNKQIKQLGKQISELGNKFGRYTEGLFYPSLEKILIEDFNLEHLAYRHKAQQDGSHIELDMIGVSDGEEGKVVVVEIKFQLRGDDLTNLIKTLERFPRFFSQYQSKKLFGVIAAVGITNEQLRRAEELGLYVVKISDENFKLASKKPFIPRNFSTK